MKLMRLLPLAIVLVLLSGCVRNPGDTMNLKQHSGPVKVRTGGKSPAELTEGRHIVPIRTLQNTAYVSLADLTQATGYHGAWLRDGSYGVGDNDAAWIFRTGQSTVAITGKKMRMPASAIKEGNQLYIPVSALHKLFGHVTVFAVETDDVAFFPKPTPHETGASGRHLDFADSKPAKSAKSAQSAKAVKPAMTVAIGADDHANIIAFAKKYLGIKYEFGTGSYSETGKFDCSSFTQYVFDKFGVKLPRVAGQQAEGGTFVARDMLQAGDLLFFYVPGRFKSNETVGHVGIYMGEGNMIHSSPKPEDGVQITPINKDYWKETFLYAKRFLPS
ncbi:C40 family peptidase [Cohnella silvisoli]|uniref:C40 family peptidase n=1 Tax=Cohnella silvisoli TaxID=2873699 RepID=A0ABV1KU03_9BACL|nr:C40 family peptidase [Cohnella silvisoli]MCD9022807.1 C40 family peptidase [Cohnella silvisoli]